MGGAGRQRQRRHLLRDPRKGPTDHHHHRAGRRSCGKACRKLRDWSDDYHLVRPGRARHRDCGCGWIEAFGHGAGGKLNAKWTYQDGQTVDSQDKDVAAGPQVSDFSISKPDGWPAGKYKVEISLDGNVVQSRDFEVK